MSWKDSARRIAKGKFIKFGPEEPVHVLTFTGEPQIREIESTMPGREGEKYTSFEFPVIEEGDDKILSVTQKSLLRQLIEEDDMAPLTGRTLMIKCLDPAKKTNWMIRSVSEQAEVQKWGSKDDDGRKKKFQEEVKKRTAKRKEAEEDDDQGSRGSGKEEEV